MQAAAWVAMDTTSHLSRSQIRHSLQTLEAQVMTGPYPVEPLLSDHPPACFSPKSLQRSKLPPCITIIPPDDHDVMDSFSPEEEDADEEDDDDVLDDSESSRIPLTSDSSSSDDRYKVHSGRLFLIGQASSFQAPSSPTRSPTSSPHRSSPSSFPFQIPPPPASFQSWTSPPSPTRASGSTKVPVFVRVYRCNMEHFAVVNRDPLCSSKPLYINMRHSRLLPGDSLGRFILAGHCDSGHVFQFEAPDLAALEPWLDAFQTSSPAASPGRNFVGGPCGGGNIEGAASNSMPRSPALPTLTETDEEN